MSRPACARVRLEATVGRRLSLISSLSFLPEMAISDCVLRLDQNLAEIASEGSSGGGRRETYDAGDAKTHGAAKLQ